jgi:hypothetical protein
MLLKSGCHEFGFPFRLQAREPNEHDSGVEPVLAKYEFAKVFVSSHEDRVRFVALQQNRIIVDPRSKFGDKQDVMTIRAEPVDNLAIDAFVRYNFHSAVFSAG